MFNLFLLTINNSIYMMSAEQVFFANGIEIKAARGVYRRYGINRYELNLLCSLYCYLAVKGRRAVAYTALLDWLGISFTMKSKFRGYLHGLEEKGCVHKLNYNTRLKQPGNSLGISVFGANVLKYYYQEVSRLETRAKELKDIVLVDGRLEHYTTVHFGRS